MNRPLRDLIDAAHRVEGELAVVAVPEIVVLFVAAVKATQAIEESGRFEDYLRTRDVLTRAMRQDLHTFAGP